jgi:hypothetical protein
MIQNECKKCHTTGEWYLSALGTCPACVREWVKDYRHRPARADGYRLHTYADGYGNWHARIVFTTALGNTAEADRIASNAMQSAKRAIRAAIVERMQPIGTRRLKYRVSENKSEPGSGRLMELVISEN